MLISYAYGVAGAGAGAGVATFLLEIRIDVGGLGSYIARLPAWEGGILVPMRRIVSIARAL